MTRDRGNGQTAFFGLSDSNILYSEMGMKSKTVGANMVVLNWRRGTVPS
jgi:hypothetical protein